MRIKSRIMKLKCFIIPLLASLALIGGIATSLFIAQPVLAAPAACYWVGGTGNWSDATNHWAITSGGLPNAADMPDSTSNVFVDADSGVSPVITMDANSDCNTINWTGAITPTLSGSFELRVYGSWIGNPNLLINKTGRISFRSSAAGNTITSNGMSFNTVGAFELLFSGTGSWTLNDNLSAYLVTFNNAIFNTNNKNVVTYFTVFQDVGAKDITLGSSTWQTLSWIVRDTPPTFHFGTSNVIVASNGTTTFQGGGVNYASTITLNGYTVNMTGSNTFSNLILSGTSPYVNPLATINITDGTTQTVIAMSRDISSTPITLQGTGTGGWHIAKSGGGVIAINYLTIKYSTAPAATFYAGDASIDGGNNSGWVFTPYAAPTVATSAASGITMDKDGITGGVFNGNLSAVSNAAYTLTHFDYGLTSAYGSSTSVFNTYATGAFSTPSSIVHQIYAMGDSLTANGTYESVLNSSLGVAWNVNNEGIAGNDTLAMIDRFLTNIVTPSNSEYVIIWGGINDIQGDNLPAATIEANLQTMYTAAHNMGCKVVAINLTPFKGFTTWTTGKQAVEDAVNAWIASGTPTGVDYKIDMYSLLVDPSNANTLLPAYDSGDHLHLTTAGYTLVGNTVFSGATWTPKVLFPTNLIAGQTYHYRAVAVNTNGTAYGADQTFTFTMPSISTGGANNSSVNTTISGSVTNMGVASSTYGYFEWGYTPSLGNTTPFQVLTGIGTFNAVINNDPSRVLYYRADIVNGSSVVSDIILGYIPIGTSVSAYNLSDMILVIFMGLGLIVLITMFAKNTDMKTLLIMAIYIIVLLLIIGFLNQALINMWGG